MTDRILVRHIPRPGVWKRAPLLTPDGRKATAHSGNPRRAWVPTGFVTQNRPITDDWHVCLSDTLGLGLAGLASRVAQRLGEEKPGFPTSLVHAIGSPMLRPLSGLVPLWVREDRHTCLVNIATYLALTDRLCDAVGLQPEEHEVAKWSPGDLPKAGEPTEWFLSVGGVGSRMCRMFRLPHEDWLSALEAAIAEAS